MSATHTTRQLALVGCRARVGSLRTVTATVLRLSIGPERDPRSASGTGDLRRPVRDHCSTRALRGRPVAAGTVRGAAAPDVPSVRGRRRPQTPLTSGEEVGGVRPPAPGRGSEILRIACGASFGPVGSSVGPGVAFLADDAQQPPAWASSTLVRWRVSLSPTSSVGFGRPYPSSARTHEPFTLLNDRYAVAQTSAKRRSVRPTKRH